MSTTPPSPPDGRHAVIHKWRGNNVPAMVECAVCDEQTKSPSIQCSRCKAQVCSECTENNGDSTQRRKEMAADYLEDGCWCVINDQINDYFNMEFALPASASNKRKRGPVSDRDLYEQLFVIRNPDPGNMKDNAARIDILQNKAIVVIGAGIVGLSIAFQLATKAKSNGTIIKITVIDSGDGACGLASKQCAGLLSLDGMDDRWAPLTMDFEQRWQSIQDAMGSLDATANSDLAADHPRINPQKAAAWMGQRCEDLGVEFYFQVEAYVVDFDHRGRVTTVGIGHKDFGRPQEFVECSDIVLATGPYTTEVYKRLFPNSILRLENHVDRVIHSDTAEASSSKISTATGGCPIIGKVPTSALGDSDGVYLAYGFGKYGTTLAPTVAKLVSQLLYGEQPVVDLRNFRVDGVMHFEPKESTSPPAKKSKRPKAKGKGAGKSRTKRATGVGSGPPGEVGPLASAPGTSQAKGRRKFRPIPSIEPNQQDMAKTPVVRRSTRLRPVEDNGEIQDKPMSTRAELAKTGDRLKASTSSMSAGEAKGKRTTRAAPAPKSKQPKKNKATSLLSTPFKPKAKRGTPADGNVRNNGDQPPSTRTPSTLTPSPKPKLTLKLSVSPARKTDQMDKITASSTLTSPARPKLTIKLASTRTSAAGSSVSSIQRKAEV